MKPNAFFSIQGFFIFGILAGIYMANPLPASAGNPVDHSPWAGLLTQYVTDGVVDYQGFKQDEARLDEYLALLETIEPPKLDKNERFAFYINAYNAWTIKLILSGYPGISSIKELGTLFQSPWKKKICRINGEIISLDTIEHEILRPGFRDPRVHFAINCASKGCPALSSRPYTGMGLDLELDASAREFINNPRHNRLEDDTLFVSSIFKWFAEDFNGDVIGFISQYAMGDFKSNLEAKGKTVRIEYLDYDWSLNGK